MCVAHTRSFPRRNVMTRRDNECASVPLYIPFYRAQSLQIGITDVLFNLTVEMSLLDIWLSLPITKAESNVADLQCWKKTLISSRLRNIDLIFFVGKENVNGSSSKLFLIFQFILFLLCSQIFFVFLYILLYYSPSQTLELLDRSSPNVYTM